MNRKLLITAATLLATLVILSVFAATNLLSKQTSSREFYVGVEYAYGGSASEIKALVDRVKDYTNLFVIGSVDLTFNKTGLDEACDYISASGLNFIVLLTSRTSYNFSIMEWLVDAHQKYGAKFLGMYKIDEPGGNQLDKGPSMLINSSTSHTQVSQDYVGNLSAMVNYYYNYTQNIFTADYVLHWFDYKANYTCIFAEFVGNESRPRIIAQNRGAAAAFNRDWGVIINWKYNQAPYLESKDELYDDLALAYSAGAKYAILFSYPNTTPYGTIAEEHFEALEKFWNTLHSNPESFGSNLPQAAYVVPKDYAFGFRKPDDGIWGLFPSDELSAKIYDDVEKLTAKYSSRFDILYDESDLTTPLLSRYSEVYFWNQTIP